MGASGQRYHRRHCVHTEAGEPCDDGPIIPDHLQQPLAAAKHRLHQAMTALGDPVADALAVIGGEEFAGLLWRVPSPTRTRFLRELNVPPASRPTAVAARMGWANLLKWALPDRNRGAQLITNFAADRIETAWDTAFGDGRDLTAAEAAVLDVLTGNPAQTPTMRLTVLCHAHECRATAVALRLALDTNLALPSWSTGTLDEIRTACLDLENVMARADAPMDSTGTIADDAVAPGLQDTAAAGPVEEAAAPVLVRTTAPAVGSLPPAPGAHDPAVPADDPTPAATGGTQSVDFAAAAEALADSRDQATRSVAALADVIGRDGIPQPADLEALQAFTAAATTARRLLDQAGHPLVHTDTVTALLTALHAAGTAADQQGLRERIATLGDLTGPAQFQAQVDGVAALATDLYLAPTWDAQQQQQADGLQALLDLIDAAAAGDVAAVTEAHPRTQALLPADLTQIGYPAMLGQLATRPAVTDRVPTPPATEAVAVAPVAAATAIGDAAPAAPAPPPPQATVTPHDPARLDDAPPPATVAADDQDAVSDHPVVSVTPPAAGLPDPAPSPAAADDLSSNTAAEALVAGPDTIVSDAPDTTGADMDATVDNDTALGRQVVQTLVEDRRFSLAMHAAEASGAVRRAHALRVLTLAEAVRSETGPVAAALHTALDADLNAAPTADPATQLILLAGGLRACLTTADAIAGTSVLTLARAMPHLSDLAALASTIGTASVRGTLYSTEVLATFAPIAGADNDVAATADAAADELRKRRHLEFARANQIIDVWWSPTGLIGKLLDVAANDRRSEVDSVTEELRKLTKNLETSLMREDDRLRNGNKALQGQARRKLLEQARTSLAKVSAWVDAVRANQHTTRNRPIPANLAELRTQVKQQWLAAEQQLTELATTADGLHGAAARICRDSLQRTVELLDGYRLTGTDRDPDLVLCQDLLRSPDLPFTADGQPAVPVTLDHVRQAAATRWDAAFEARLTAEEFGTALLITAAIADPAVAQSMRDRATSAATAARQELQALHREVAAAVERAARLGQLDEAASSDVTSRLEAASLNADDDRDATVRDLGAIRRRLEEIRSCLPQYLCQAQQALRDRVSREKITGPDSAALLDDIHQRIDDGDLATAEEYLLAALNGEAPPTAEHSNELAVLLQTVEQLPAGITADVVDAVRGRRTHAGFDFGALSAPAQQAAAEGLAAWHEVGALERPNQVRKEAMTLIFRLAGIEFANMRPLPETTGRRRSGWELLNVTRVGNARVPAFGSLAGDRQRLLLCWGDPDIETMFNWIQLDPSDLPVIVLRFGTMTAAQRATLAGSCAERPDKPVIVIDDAALLYLALHGGGRFSEAERILLPFAATNPYHPHANAAVPEEMFFGRAEERSRITSALGPNLLYGGRQLGKTASLQDSARHFRRVDGQEAVYVSLPNSVGVNVSPDALWEQIAVKLAALKITPPRRTKDQIKNVTAAITSWLDEDTTRRLLLLIDECDGFFDADAERDFAHTTRLRNLMNDTHRRFKVVFAGLHQVQRFAHLPNQPLASAHLGEPIAIGPLNPDPAYRLLFSPMDVLGIRFDSDQLIHRVLAYCNYQPKLLQLVGEALVDSALRRRGRQGPPYRITEDDLERVIGSDTVRRSVRDTVHLTLNLDPRYKLIALVVALAALDHGADHTISTPQLRDECRSWWPEGFAGQGPHEFQALLEEMRDLGVLAPADGRWRLRSSNVLRLLGSTAQIWDELCSTEWRDTVTKLSAEQARRKIDGGLISPFTEQQISHLVSRGSHLRIVIGTPGTGVERVRALLDDAKGYGARFELATPNSPAAYTRELRAGAPGDVHRLVLSDLTRTKVDRIIDTLAKAISVQPQAGVSRTVVAVLDATEPGVLDALYGPVTTVNPDDIMPLRRVSATGLRAWLFDNEKLSCFSDATSHTALMGVTGGWLTLLDLAASHAANGWPAQRICDAISTHLATAEGADALVTAAGLSADPIAASAFDVLIKVAEPVTSEELSTWCAEAGPHETRTAEVLRTLDVIVQQETDGRWIPEPVIAQAWKTLHHT